MSDPFKEAMVEETSRNRLAPEAAGSLGPGPKVELHPFEDRSSFRALMDDLDNITIQARILNYLIWCSYDYITPRFPLRKISAFRPLRRNSARPRDRIECRA